MKEQPVASMPALDVCGIWAEPMPKVSAKLPRPVHLHYASESSRLHSFKNCSQSLKQKSELLAEAGFFYSGPGDKTICYYCGGALYDWNEYDKPWEQHTLWYSDCIYVQLRNFTQKAVKDILATSIPKMRLSLTEEPNSNVNIHTNKSQTDILHLTEKCHKNKNKHHKKYMREPFKSALQLTFIVFALLFVNTFFLGFGLLFK